MDLTLTDEEREIRDWVRTFVTKELMPLEPQVLERERNGERGFSLDELRGLQEKAKQSGFFGILTKQSLSITDFPSTRALMDHLRTYLRAWNKNPTPFEWTKPARAIIKSHKRMLDRISTAVH